MRSSFWWPVEVPRALVDDARLPTTSRYLYMILAGQGRGAGVCRLTLPALGRVAGVRLPETLRRHLRMLVERGWLEISGRRAAPRRYAVRSGMGIRLRLPARLVFDRSLAPAAKCLYAAVAVRPGLAVNQRKLAALAGMGRSSVVRHTEALRTAGWLAAWRAGNASCYRYAALDPHLEQRRAVLRRLEARLERASFLGEELMKEMLTVLVDDARFADNVRPGFLVNPETGERMEFDRWYTGAGVALEFNGPQHYGPTDMFPDAREARRQRARDLAKAAVARAQGIQLIVVQARDLTFRRLRTLVAPHLPVRRVEHQDPVVQFLVKCSRRYIQRVQRSPVVAAARRGGSVGDGGVGDLGDTGSTEGGSF